MSKRSAISFTRRAPDNITEELVAVLSSKASFEFKPLFDIILLNLRERNAASGGEEMLRLRAYEKLHGLAVRDRTACDAGTNLNVRIFSFHSSCLLVLHFILHDS